MPARPVLNHSSICSRIMWFCEPAKSHDSGIVVRPWLTKLRVAGRRRLLQDVPQQLAAAVSHQHPVDRPAATTVAAADMCGPPPFGVVGADARDEVVEHGCSASAGDDAHGQRHRVHRLRARRAGRARGRVAVRRGVEEARVERGSPRLVGQRAVVGGVGGRARARRPSAPSGRRSVVARRCRWPRAGVVVSPAIQSARPLTEQPVAPTCART